MTTIKDSKGKEYKQAESGTCYNVETPDNLINTMERLRESKTRIKLCYGDTETGVSWLEDLDVTGTIGRSTGTIKIPLMIHSERSHGGPCILTHCILKITETKTGYVYYRHPKYKEPNIEIVPSDLPEYQYNTVVDGRIQGRHRSLRSAQIYKSKLM